MRRPFLSRLSAHARLTLVLLLASACAPQPTVAPTTTNAECATCHPSQAADLAASRHSHANGSQVFQALRTRASPRDAAFCDSCHLAHDAPGESGVGCVTCHSASGDLAVLNAQLLWDPGSVRGPFAPLATAAGHPSVASDFLRSSDLCGTCHEVRGPGAFVETPYSEWSASPAMRGISCADCHMSPAPGDDTATRAQGPAAVVAGSNLPMRTLSSHRFVGPDDPDAATLLARAVSITVATEASTAHVTVTNRNPAHAFPSGARFARDVWLEVSVQDTAGNVTAVSGALDGDGAIVSDPQLVALNDALTHAGMFALPLDADPPVARAITAGASQTYTYAIPAAASVRVRLRYRTVSHALQTALGVADAGALYDLADVMTPTSP